MLSIREIEELPIVFIIGRGRSGTSLLQTIFDANPGVKTANESPFIIHLKQAYFKVSDWTPKKTDAFITDLYKDKKFAFLWAIDPEDLKKRILSYNLKELTFPILCKLVYLSVSSPFSKDKTRLLVDKNPLYSQFIQDLKEVFPDAKFIHLIRDYRDNANSERKAFKIKNVIVLAHRWKRYNKVIDQQKDAQHFYTIRYEDLVTYPDKFLQEICDFLKIPYLKSMSQFYDTTRNAYTDENYKNGIMAGLVQDIHVNLLQPINTAQIGKWKTELSAYEIEVIEYITGDFARRYNYLPSVEHPKRRFFLVSVKNYVRDRFSNMVFKVYYKLPFSIRDAMRALSDGLFDTFGYSNIYNEVSVRHRNVADHKHKSNSQEKTA